MSAVLRLSMTSRTDEDGKEYFFTVPNFPASVDFSKSVVFVYPFEDEDGNIGADLVIKPYNGKHKTK